ncbi:hypothetical protein GE115_08680 [Agromyces sp. CFH 90414]|uniref:Uncharacterized protein n=1 Tax=Agromyces agglutinans TaxID=2662258 RepID=A0A6I2F5L8_9MICO|nr:hypothetical protein [Agromyces agglutinans]MRG59942.1 hypothetical protein [Agromyces agglutinans]
MTDSTRPDGSTPDRDADGEREPDDQELRDLDRSNDRPAGGDTAEGEGPGAPGNAEPMTESTDGGLSGGDPGVEE